jgi:HEAT repeat protein
MVILVSHVPGGQIDVEPAMNALIERLDDPDPAVRLAAIQGLGAVGPKALGDPPARLVAVMDDDSDQSRGAAVEALAVFHRGLPPLIPSLVKSAENAAPQVRAGYLKLLSRVRPRSFSGDAVPGLITALGSRDGEIVAVAANDLVAFEDPAPSPIRAPGRTEARSAILPLIAALDTLLGSKANDVVTLDPVVAIAEALGRLAPDTPSSEEAVAALAKVLRAGDTRRRVAAATALGRFHAGAAVFTALTDSIGERDLAVRLAVLRAIHDVDFRAPFIVPKALGAALEEESAEVRAAAAAALWRAGLGIDPYVAVLLRHAEHDADARVREVCAGTLQHLAPPLVTMAVLPDLIPALRSPDAKLRVVASQILAALGPAAAPAVPALIRSMADPSARKSWPDPGAQAAEALGRIAPRTAMAEQAITALIEALGAAEIERKNAAIRALANFGPAAAPAVPVLVRIMKEARARTDDRLAICCAETLVKIGSQDVAAGAIRALREIAEQGNQHFRVIAADALTNLKAVD